MSTWNQFEDECFLFLKKIFCDEILVSHEGGSNSEVSDFKIESNKKFFYIEAKKCPAQCGQFVLFPNNLTQKFEYSSKNKTSYNKAARKIIEYMNDNFNRFASAGTKGCKISFEGCQDFFIQWIQKMYETKQTKLIITNDKTVLPIEKFSSYFHVSATYRIKKSGSRKISSKSMQSVIKYIKERYHSINVYRDAGKLCYTGNDKLVKERFLLEGNEYYFSQNNEIRELSNTLHANVIFTITLRAIQAKGLNESEIKDLANKILS